MEIILKAWHAAALLSFIFLPRPLAGGKEAKAVCASLQLHPILSLKDSGVSQILTSLGSGSVEDCGDSSCLWSVPSHLLNPSQSTLGNDTHFTLTKRHRSLHTCNNVKSLPSTIRRKSNALKLLPYFFFFPRSILHERPASVLLFSSNTFL